MSQSVREILTWEQYGVAARDLAHQVAASGYRPDLVLSVARGGLGLGMSLGYALGVKNVHVVNVEFYTGVDERLAEPVLLAPTPSPADLHGARVLVADDVADTGHTLRVIDELCAPLVLESRTAVVFEKPATTVRADYVWRRTGAWIEFPWSSEPPVVG